MKQLTSGELSVFSEQLGMLLGAGVGIYESLGLMKEGLEEGYYKEIIEKLEEAVDEEDKLGESFYKVDAFPSYFIQMVKIGTMSGNLDVVMGRLAWYYSREEQMITYIKRALFYPFMLLGIMSTVILVITTQVIPVFEEVLRNLGIELSGTAVYMMRIGTLIAQLAVVILLSLFVIGIMISLMMCSKAREVIIGKLLHHSGLYHKMMVARFIKALAMMIGCGIEVTYAIEMSNTLIQHKVLNETIEECLIEMKEQHSSLMTFVERSELLNEIGKRRLAIGMRTGCGDQILTKLAEEYEKEIEYLFDRLLSKIEPSIVFILSVVVGSILLSVMLPLMSIMSTIG